jgi:hypothetical protein
MSSAGEMEPILSALCEKDHYKSSFHNTDYGPIRNLGNYFAKYDVSCADIALILWTLKLSISLQQLIPRSIHLSEDGNPVATRVGFAMPIMDQFETLEIISLNTMSPVPALILWFLILSISLQQLIHVSEEGNPDFQG